MVQTHIHPINHSQQHLKPKQILVVNTHTHTHTKKQIPSQAQCIVWQSKLWLILTQKTKTEGGNHLTLLTSASPKEAWGGVNKRLWVGGKTVAEIGSDS